MKRLEFLNGVLSDGTPYTITIIDGVLVFQCDGKVRYTAQGPAMLMDYLQAKGWKLPADAVQRMSDFGKAGAQVVSALIDKKGHWDSVTADDIDTILKQTGVGWIQEAIRTLLLGRRTHNERDTTP